MLDRLREYAKMEPARLRELVRAVLLIGTLLFNLQVDDAQTTTIVNGVVVAVSVALSEQVRNRVSPVDDGGGSEDE